jgi:hypothetical protein
MAPGGVVAGDLRKETPHFPTHVVAFAVKIDFLNRRISFSR